MNQTNDDYKIVVLFRLGVIIFCFRCLTKNTIKFGIDGICSFAMYDRKELTEGGILCTYGKCGEFLMNNIKYKLNHL
jgi:hypothetical protein